MTTTMNTDYKNWHELKKGMLIRTKRDIGTKSQCYSGAEWRTIKENTVLMLTDASSRGDVAPRFVGYFDDGEFTPAHDCNGLNLRGMKAWHFLREGHKSRWPEDLGLADPSVYEIVGQLEGETYELYSIQAPHRNAQWGINPFVLVHRDGKFTFDEGYWQKWALCYDGGPQ